MRKGFTLAEVLITLGIIGVVAALTIPTLINNYQKKQYVTKLQKAISVLNNGTKLMMADEGVYYFNQLAFKKCWSGAVSATSEERSCINDYYSKYFKITQYQQVGQDENYHTLNIHQLNGATSNAIRFWAMLYMGGYYSFQTQDGIMYWPSEATDRAIVDINGNEAPNQLGRDIFVLDVNEFGQYSPYLTNKGWESTNSQEYCGDDQTLQKYAAGCSGRIFDEGWKMNY